MKDLDYKIGFKQCNMWGKIWNRICTKVQEEDKYCYRVSDRLSYRLDKKLFSRLGDCK